ncbi:DUF4333 domain-containing protein [Glycomyces paridis]|uniref:DUF4333 domain-containing protein n=1 Tax=Glycomyces paridis TaxID=2126555 RepID=A0A4S8P139_9ACTN|nr:DUF4333 domain-containing protein [Glycomyces paridis]
MAFAALGLAACTAEVGPTVSGEKLAEAAADALEGELGSRPEVDCGDDSIIAKQDKEVDCVLTDPDTGTEYDTTVTFTGVDGDQWDIAVQVASEPKGGAETSAAEETSEAADDSAAQLEIEATALADAAEDALEEQVGARPEIDCGEVNITIYEGRTTYCELTEGGEVYEVTLSVTEIDGEQFNFDVQVADTPK